VLEGHQKFDALTGFADRYLRGLSQLGVLALALIGIGAIGVLDYRFGVEISLSDFYLLPVGIATWYAGLKEGALCAVLADIPSVVEQARIDQFAGHPGVLIWALVMQAGVMLVVVYLLDRLRAHVATEAALARIDTLTGILNRRGFLERLEFTILLTRRQQLRFALAFIDLDNFKTINDSLGHAEGDRVLRLAARVFQDSTRHSDVAGRLGGDEFALLLPGLDPATAATFINDLHDEFRRAFVRERLPLTCSIGCAVFDCAVPDTNEVIRAADALMYEVKRLGKNSVLIGDYTRPVTASERESIPGGDGA
jgi:diguanylate cyclase (GGDEF)-like protein